MMSHSEERVLRRYLSLHFVQEVSRPRVEVGEVAGNRQNQRRQSIVDVPESLDSSASSFFTKHLRSSTLIYFFFSAGTSL